MNNQNEKRIEKMEIISDLADKYLEQAMSKGHPFSEGLCNWAVNKAEQEIGSFK